LAEVYSVTFFRSLDVFKLKPFPGMIIGEMIMRRTVSTSRYKLKVTHINVKLLQTGTETEKEQFELKYFSVEAVWRKA
jgi:hypothetical protein